MINKFAERLRELRIENGLKQSDVAQELGLSSSAIAKYEQGKNEPCLDLVIKTAEFFGVTTDYILGVDKSCL